MQGAGTVVGKETKTMKKELIRKSTSSITGNCVTDLREDVVSRARVAAKKHDDWEKKQSFEVIRPDHKTTIYRRIKDTDRRKGKVIHKGKI